MTDDRRTAAWGDASNWSLYGTIYNAPQDDRVIVPKKRIYLGWTLNFAHPESYMLLGVLAGGVAAATRRRGGRHRRCELAVLDRSPQSGIGVVELGL